MDLFRKIIQSKIIGLLHHLEYMLISKELFRSGKLVVAYSLCNSTKNSLPVVFL
jgi:hypothetical protein